MLYIIILAPNILPLEIQLWDHFRHPQQNPSKDLSPGWLGRMACLKKQKINKVNRHNIFNIVDCCTAPLNVNQANRKTHSMSPESI